MPRPTNGDDDEVDEDYVDGDGGVDEDYFWWMMKKERPREPSSSKLTK